MKFPIAFIVASLISANAIAAGPRPAPQLLFSAIQAGAPPADQASGQDQDTLKGLLLKIYLTSARFNDLLGLVKTVNWKMTNAEKSQLEQEVGSAKGQLQTLEKWRYQFDDHPEDSDAGGKTLDALGRLATSVESVAAGVRRFGGAGEAQPFEPALQELSGLQNSLESYLESRFPAKFPRAESSAATSAGTGQHVETHAAPAEKPTATNPRQVTAIHPGASPQPSSLATTPNEKAAQPATATASVKPSAPTQAARALQPEQVKALLQNVFLEDARASDLLSLLRLDQWTISDAERALINERLQAVKSQIGTLETWRTQFSYNLQKTGLGEKTVSALGNLVPGILGIETMVAQYESPAAAPLMQVAGQLASARNSLESYVVILQSQQQSALATQPAGLPGGKELETERVNGPSPAAPPVSSLVLAQPPLTPGQVKAVLYRVYISEFRVRDLLGQERPEQWEKAPVAERTLASQARAALISGLSELEKWRSMFSQHPDNVYFGFQTYLAVNALFHPLRVFGREAGKYESENLATGYSRRENDMEAQLNGLTPYISFILQNESRNLGTFQTDLASCQNQLGYAMHSLIRAPQPMKNEVPVFQGGHTRRRKTR